MTYKPITLLVAVVAVVAVAVAAPSPATAVVSGQGSAAAHSHSIGADGVQRGECAYTNSNGVNVRVRYTEYTDGRVEVESVEPSAATSDPSSELAQCRAAAEATRRQVAQRLHQVQLEMDREREAIQREWTRLSRPHIPLRSVIPGALRDFIPTP